MLEQELFIIYVKYYENKIDWNTEDKQLWMFVLVNVDKIDSLIKVDKIVAAAWSGAAPSKVASV